MSIIAENITVKVNLVPKSSVNHMFETLVQKIGNSYSVISEEEFNNNNNKKNYTFIIRFENLIMNDLIGELISTKKSFVRVDSIYPPADKEKEYFHFYVSIYKDENTVKTVKKSYKEVQIIPTSVWKKQPQIKDKQQKSDDSILMDSVKSAIANKTIVEIENTVEEITKVAPEETRVRQLEEELKNSLAMINTLTIHNTNLQERFLIMECKYQMDINCLGETVNKLEDTINKRSSMYFDLLEENKVLKENVMYYQGIKRDNLSTNTN